ncbi:biogenesis of lysosome-related organelles complex 1 subunit 6 [Episyrphus balteatus]|uniref:biogenesis of lysosome-related organelles complex 1 subunit 6 n=1 Tax=Episyrphus balteatus TaxID=286459 RepID=UPI0024853BA9|nr:biogenesis of lysosome-related organelles complex 1 subunit 6 [Episyrphus balteatus]
MSTIDNNSNQRHHDEFTANERSSSTISSSEDNQQSLASIQMATGLLQIYEPPLIKVRNHLKELIGKQNKIYIDLSTEKYRYDNVEIAGLQEMMNTVKVYREKLVKMKKQMQSIYQRTKVLKKRAANIQACKQKEYARKLQKQQQEEALIGKRNQNSTISSTSTTTTSSDR